MLLVSSRIVSACEEDEDDEEEDPLAPMITWKDFLRLMPWEIVILVGAGYALAAGCKVGQEYKYLKHIQSQSYTVEVRSFHTIIMCLRIEYRTCFKLNVILLFPFNNQL